MFKSHSVNVSPGQMYRPLSSYYGINPGQVGTMTDANGQTTSIPVPSFSAPMNVQSVPQYNVPYLGTPMGLSHGLNSNQLTSGYFGVNNAYPQSCTTFTQRQCDGNVLPPMPPQPPVPPPAPSEQGAGLGESCSSGVMNACQDGLVCAPNDPDSMMPGSPGTCIMRSDVDTSS